MSDFEDLAEIANMNFEEPARDRRVRPSTARNTNEANRDDDNKTLGGDEMWAVHGGKNFVSCESAVEHLPPGQYTINVSDRHGIYFSKAMTALDELIILPDSVSKDVIEEIQHFWTLENRFRQFKFLWKRGALLWGPPGSGKTTTLQIISQNIVNMGGLSVYVDNPDLAGKGLKILRQVEPNRPVVIMIEDIDAVIHEYGESDLLALMDGELQIDNVLFIATTNYPERLDKRFINRPSRFDIIKKIGMPTDEARRVYLLKKNQKLADNPAELEKWVKLSKGFSVAHLKEMIVSVEVLELSLESTVKRLQAMSNIAPSSSDGEGKFGFINS